MHRDAVIASHLMRENEMNKDRNKQAGGGMYHPTQEEMVDARLTLANDLIGHVESLVSEGRVESWCAHIREQLGYELLVLVLGMMDGAAMCRGVERGALDRSMRQGLAAGRTLALELHRSDGCATCEGSRDLERLLEPN